MAELSVRNFTRRSVAPRAAFEAARALVLPSWDISLVFAGETRARALNRTLRKKEYVPNVLSYEVGTRSGEIVICPAVAARQASSYGMSQKDFMLYLFIHGLLHLKGRAHGTRMEQEERAILARLATHSPHETTHRSRHRHRNAPDEGRGR